MRVEDFTNPLKNSRILTVPNQLTFLRLGFLPFFIIALYSDRYDWALGILIAAGISDGLGFGDNAKSAILTRGVTEMARFGVALGAEAQTFWGLAGIGDVITTCISPHGRNRQVGLRLAAGEGLEDILAGMTMIAEGVFTARSVHEQARQMGIPMPITTEVYRMLYEAKDPLAAVNDLMLREHSHEGR